MPIIELLFIDNNNKYLTKLIEDFIYLKATKYITSLLKLIVSQL